MTTDYDILIVGGGMVGGSLAIALGSSGYRVGLVEAFPYGPGQQPAYDDRSIALAYGSARIFEGMGLWSYLADYVTPITNIHVSDRGHLGTTRLEAQEEGVSALGYVVESRAVGRVLNERYQDIEKLDVIAPARLVNLEQDEEQVRAELESDGETQFVTTRLLVAADGTGSPIRERLGIEVERLDYQQTAIIANVSTSEPHQNVAYERFTDSGPLALLPMTKGRCSLVWTHRSSEVEAIEGLSDEAFLKSLQKRFGQRLGRFTRVGQRASYPLAQMRAKEVYQGRVALAGNAMHTLHPVAGQGFNLGLRDVAVLAELLFDASQHAGDPGAEALLQAYAEWRHEDMEHVAQYTDLLVRLFSNSWAPLGHARSAGLALVNNIPSMKHALARQSMGMTTPVPRLARGLPLQAYADRSGT